MAKEAGPVAKQLQRDLNRYRSLKQHDTSEPEFREALFKLQKWQAQRMRKTHQGLLENDKYRVATEFFLDDIYGGIDLSDIANEAERVINKALKILPEKVMVTATYALELNALSAELDESLADYLFYEMGESDICMEAYTEAFRRSADLEIRQRQVELAKSLAVGIDKYVRSRVVYTTFKLVKKPAHKKGIGNLYNFMGKGFEAMRPMGSASEVIHRIVDRELELVEQIFAGDASPYGFTEV
jgi:tetratricopeptide (TPR) repeat protein